MTRADRELTWTHAIAFGANANGVFGEPEQTLARVLRLLPEAGISVLAMAPKMRTRPVGGGSRTPYLNTVLLVHVAMAPAQLLRTLKRFERSFGRRVAGLNAARPLDLDILLWRRGVVGWTVRRVNDFDHGGHHARGVRRRAGIVQIPHPALHRRAFMMVPLAHVLPFWWHGALGCRGLRLVRAVRQQPGDVVMSTE